MPVLLYTVEEAPVRMITTAPRPTPATHGRGEGTPRFIRRLIPGRRIAFTRLGRHVRIEADAVEAFIAAGRVKPAARMPRQAAGLR